MSKVARKRLVRWPLILVSCLMVFLVWPTVGFAYAMVAFEIDGNATGPLSPGIQVPIELRFTNRHPAPMTVSRLWVSLQGLSTPAATDAHPCSLADFEVTQAAGAAEWTVPANTSLDLRQLGMPEAAWPRVALRDRPVNQDGCKGSTLTMGYTARGILDN
jgi:hypothetical protein